MRQGTRRAGRAIAAVLVAGLIGVVPAAADHNADDHSKNVRKLVRQPIRIGKKTVAQGSDLAFQGKVVVAGSYQGTALYRILARKPYLKQIAFHACPGSQGDVSIWGKLLFVSIDSASSNSRRSSVCNNTKTNLGNNSREKEGIRIVDISRARHPRQVGFVETDCGSHTHTLVPDGADLYLYVESYPLGAPTPTCNPVSHRKISVVRIDKEDPAKSDVVATPDVTPAIGCHDVTVFPARDIAAAACISESQMWDIKDPASPQIIAHIPHPEGMQISHSSAITWDGKYAIFSDEYLGAAGGGGCAGDEDSNVGAMFFYDITTPSAPELQGHHSLPRVPPFDSEDEAGRFRCTTHNYNILPMKDPGKYIAVSSYYMGGLAAVDFSDPTNPTEKAHYLPLKGGVAPDMWSAYWYNGRIYANEHASSLGVSVYRLKRSGRAAVRYFKTRMNPQTQLKRFQ